MVICRTGLALAALLLASARSPARAQGSEDWTSDAEYLGLPKGWRPQFRFLLGSQLATDGVARPDFSVAGQSPGGVESASSFRPGFSLLVQIGGLGPEAEHGAFIEFMNKRQKAVLNGLGTDFGYLNTSGVFFSPSLGRHIALGRGWFCRPFLDFGGGLMWSTLDPTDPNLWPVPAAGGRQFKEAPAWAWKAGAGVDLHWSRTSGIVAAVHYMNHATAITATDGNGTELGRVNFDGSSWGWMLGAVFSY